MLACARYCETAVEFFLGVLAGHQLFLSGRETNALAAELIVVFNIMVTAQAALIVDLRILKWQISENRELRDGHRYFTDTSPATRSSATDAIKSSWRIVLMGVSRYQVK